MTRLYYLFPVTFYVFISMYHGKLLGWASLRMIPLTMK